MEFYSGAPNNTDGEINLLATSTTGLGGNFSGTAFSVDFSVAAGATGSTTVSIGSTFPVASPTFDTEIDDEQSNMIALSPAPTNDPTTDPVAGSVAIGFSVTVVQAMDTGFTATFNQPFNPSILHLYDTAFNGNRPADVTLVGARRR